MHLTQRFTSLSLAMGTLNCHGLLPGAEHVGNHVTCPDFYWPHSNTESGYNQKQECLFPFSWYLANLHSVPTAETVAPSSKRWHLVSFPLWFWPVTWKVIKEKWSYLVYSSHAPSRVYLWIRDHKSSERSLLFLSYWYFYIPLITGKCVKSSQFSKLAFNSIPKEEQKPSKRQFHGLDPEHSNSEGVSSRYPSSALLLGTHSLLLTQPQPGSSATLTRAQALSGAAASAWNAFPNTFHFANSSSSFSHILISLPQKLFLISTLNELPLLVHTFLSPFFPSSYENFSYIFISGFVHLMVLFLQVQQ